MSNFDFDAVIKIGSMALIRKDDNDLDYNIFSRLAKELRPGYILVSSGAAEIGRLDYMRRNGGRELKGDLEELMTYYSAQGQPILMQRYREFVNPDYSVRQVLIEHSHFNDPRKVKHIKKLLFESANQNAIPIINYNDAVSNTENMKWELSDLRSKRENVVECVDNDETAVVISNLVRAETLVILSSLDGIYTCVSDPETLIEEVTANTYEDMEKEIESMIANCRGASREGANGAAAKLNFVKNALKNGTTVIIANAKYSLTDILEGKVKRTYLKVER